MRAYIAASVDGRIATSDGGVAWLDRFNESGEDYGYEAFLADVSTLVMGSATFEMARSFGEWPYPGKRTVVLSTRTPPDLPPRTVVASGDARRIAADLRSTGPGDVWIVGGGLTLRAFLDAGEVDELDLFVMPTLLREGPALFPASTRLPVHLELEEQRRWPSGVVRLRYTLRRESTAST